MKYRFVYFTITIFWIIVSAVVTWGVFTYYSQEQYPQYSSCTTLLKDYPQGIAADWAPQIGPHTVLNANNRGIWTAQRVSWISDDAYWSQHNWLDGDNDGIMCELDKPTPQPKAKKK